MPIIKPLLGEDRIEAWSAIGRNIRCGALQALKTSDQDRLCELIKSGQKAEAIEFLNLLRPLYLDMSAILMEWSLGFAEILQLRMGAELEKLVTFQVHENWKSLMAAKEDSPTQVEAQQTLLAILNPSSSLEREARQKLCERLNETPLKTWQEATRRVADGQTDSAIEALDQFTHETRARHDFLCQYLWLYPSEIERSCSQKISEDIMLESFQTVSQYESFYNAMATLTPEGAVAIIAEHLRAHFSGPGRRGQVEIIEEHDRYRMVFDACGSGGAMRRKAAIHPSPGLTNYAEASAATWGRAGEVPSFCAHCAQNEMAMIDRFGYPAWVVDFDPDPMKPCGWTVFKSFEKVPEEFYERVGRKKDPKKIKKPPKD